MHDLYYQVITSENPSFVTLGWDFQDFTASLRSQESTFQIRSCTVFLCNDESEKSHAGSSKTSMKKVLTKKIQVQSTKEREDKDSGLPAAHQSVLLLSEYIPISTGLLSMQFQSAQEESSLYVNKNSKKSKILLEDTFDEQQDNPALMAEDHPPGNNSRAKDMLSSLEYAGTSGLEAHPCDSEGANGQEIQTTYSAGVSGSSQDIPYHQKPAGTASCAGGTGREVCKSYGALAAETDVHISAGAGTRSKKVQTPYGGGAPGSEVKTDYGTGTPGTELQTPCGTGAVGREAQIPCGGEPSSREVVTSYWTWESRWYSRFSDHLIHPMLPSMSGEATALGCGMPSECEVTIVKETGFFEKLFMEKLSVYMDPIIAVSSARGWLLVHFWEGESYAVDLGALSPGNTQGVPGKKMAGGTPDNVHKWAIIHSVGRMLSDSSILKVVHNAHDLSNAIEEKANLKVVRVFDVLEADRIIRGHEFAMPLEELLCLYGIQKYSSAKILTGSHRISVPENPVDYRRKSQQDAITDLRELSQTSAKMIPSLYRLMLSLMSAPMLEELNQRLNAIIKTNPSPDCHTPLCSTEISEPHNQPVRPTSYAAAVAGIIAAKEETIKQPGRSDEENIAEVKAINFEKATNQGAASLEPERNALLLPAKKKKKKKTPKQASTSDVAVTQHQPNQQEPKKQTERSTTSANATKTKKKNKTSMSQITVTDNHQDKRKQKVKLATKEKEKKASSQQTSAMKKVKLPSHTPGTDIPENQTARSEVGARDQDLLPKAKIKTKNSDGKKSADQIAHSDIKAAGQNASVGFKQTDQTAGVATSSVAKAKDLIPRLDAKATGQPAMSDANGRSLAPRSDTKATSLTTNADFNPSGQATSSDNNATGQSASSDANATSLTPRSEAKDTGQIPTSDGKTKSQSASSNLGATIQTISSDGKAKGLTANKDTKVTKRDAHSDANEARSTSILDTKATDYTSSLPAGTRGHHKEQEQKEYLQDTEKGKIRNNSSSSDFEIVFESGSLVIDGKNLDPGANQDKRKQLTKRNKKKQASAKKEKRELEQFVHEAVKEYEEERASDNAKRKDCVKCKPSVKTSPVKSFSLDRVERELYQPLNFHLTRIFPETEITPPCPCLEQKVKDKVKITESSCPVPFSPGKPGKQFKQLSQATMGTNRNTVKAGPPDEPAKKKKKKKKKRNNLPQVSSKPKKSKKSKAPDLLPPSTKTDLIWKPSLCRIPGRVPQQRTPVLQLAQEPKPQVQEELNQRLNAIIKTNPSPDCHTPLCSTEISEPHNQPARPTSYAAAVAGIIAAKDETLKQPGHADEENIAEVKAINFEKATNQGAASLEPEATNHPQHMKEQNDQLERNALLLPAKKKKKKKTPKQASTSDVAVTQHQANQQEPKKQTERSTPSANATKTKKKNKTSMSQITVTDNHQDKRKQKVKLATKEKEKKASSQQISAMKKVKLPSQTPGTDIPENQTARSDAVARDQDLLPKAKIKTKNSDGKKSADQIAHSDIKAAGQNASVGFKQTDQTAGSDSRAIGKIPSSHSKETGLTASSNAKAIVLTAKSDIKESGQTSISNAEEICQTTRSDIKVASQPANSCAKTTFLSTNSDFNPLGQTSSSYEATDHATSSDVKATGHTTISDVTQSSDTNATCVATSSVAKAKDPIPRLDAKATGQPAISDFKGRSLAPRSDTKAASLTTNADFNPSGQATSSDNYATGQNASSDANATGLTPRSEAKDTGQIPTSDGKTKSQSANSNLGATIQTISSDGKAKGLTEKKDTKVTKIVACSDANEARSTSILDTKATDYTSSLPAGTRIHHKQQEQKEYLQDSEKGKIRYNSSSSDFEIVFESGSLVIDGKNLDPGANQDKRKQLTKRKKKKKQASAKKGKRELEQFVHEAVKEYEERASDNAKRKDCVKCKPSVKTSPVKSFSLDRVERELYQPLNFHHTRIFPETEITPPCPCLEQKVKDKVKITESSSPVPFSPGKPGEQFKQLSQATMGTNRNTVKAGPPDEPAKKKKKKKKKRSNLPQVSSIPKKSKKSKAPDLLPPSTKTDLIWKPSLCRIPDHVPQQRTPVLQLAQEPKPQVQALPEFRVTTSPQWMKPMVLQFQENKLPFFVHPLGEHAPSPINPCCITDELDDLFDDLCESDSNTFVGAFPGNIQRALLHLENESPCYSNTHLAELVLDVGRKPKARYLESGFDSKLTEIDLDCAEVTKQDLEDILKGQGVIRTCDTQAMIENTLHRIGLLANSKGKVIGMTAKVEHPIPGCLSSLYDVFNKGKSILVVGPTGVGRTTLLREAARVLSDVNKKSIYVIDTFSEVAGVGDIPHSSIGSARRLQVGESHQQHMIMREAYQNHRPEIVIIDELTSSEDAKAALEMRLRGIQVIAGVQGQTLADVLWNGALSPVTGNIQENLAQGYRMRAWSSPVVFDVLVEMLERSRWIIHWDFAWAIDEVLPGGSRTFGVEERKVLEFEEDDGAVIDHVLVMQMPASYNVYTQLRV